MVRHRKTHKTYRKSTRGKKSKTLSKRSRHRRQHKQRGGNSAFAGKPWDATKGGNYYTLNKTGGLDAPISARFINMAGKASVNELAEMQHRGGSRKRGRKHTRKHRRKHSRKHGGKCGRKHRGGGPLTNLYRSVVHKGSNVVRGLQGKPALASPDVTDQPIDKAVGSSGPKADFPNVAGIMKKSDQQVANFK